jgi:hypothetical protein
MSRWENAPDLREVIALSCKRPASPASFSG